MRNFAVCLRFYDLVTFHPVSLLITSFSITLKLLTQIYENERVG